VRALAQAHSLEAVAELARLTLHSDDDRVRVAAAAHLLAYGVGKPERASSEAVGASLVEALAVIAANQRAASARLIEGTNL
jgi:hypothetical protein